MVEPNPACADGAIEGANPPHDDPLTASARWLSGCQFPNPAPAPGPLRVRSCVCVQARIIVYVCFYVSDTAVYLHLPAFYGPPAVIQDRARHATQTRIHLYLWVCLLVVRWIKRVSVQHPWVHIDRFSFGYKVHSLAYLFMVALFEQPEYL